MWLNRGVEREIVTIWHYETCPIATGEEIGDAYCVCTYIARTFQVLEQDGLITKEQLKHLTEIPTAPNTSQHLPLVEG